MREGGMPAEEAEAAGAAAADAAAKSVATQISTVDPADLRPPSSSIH
jgi:hypothetical protein